jgi:hypothetical protein
VPASVSVKDSAASAPGFSPPDGVRDSIIEQGFGGPHDDQIRPIGDKNVPDAHGMASARARQPSRGGAVKVPASLGKNEAPLPQTNQYGGAKS